MANFFNAIGNNVVSPLFGVNYWIGLSFSVFVIATLFVFKGFYAKISKYNAFRYTIGVMQILLYFFYYLFHQISGDITWKDYMPFQLSSLLNLTSAFLLLFPYEKLFSLTFPLVAPVVLSFLIPDSSKIVYGPNNFFYYQYYFNHIIIFFGYFYLYLYGHVKYNNLMLKQTITGLIFFGTLVYLFNVSFGTNYLFIGQKGYQAFFINTGNWIPLLRFSFMLLVGLCFLIPFHYLIIKWLKPFYLNKGSEINPYYKNKKKFIKKLFIKWNDKINKNKSTNLEIE